MQHVFKRQSFNCFCFIFWNTPSVISWNMLYKNRNGYWLK
jgi:hypothetical protein